MNLNHQETATAVTQTAQPTSGDQLDAGMMEDQGRRAKCEAMYWRRIGLMCVASIVVGFVSDRYSWLYARACNRNWWEDPPAPCLFSKD